MMAVLKDNQKEAVKFSATFRGQYIISQALTKAIKVMKDVPEPHTEHSNIEDMQYLLDNLFFLFPEMETATLDIKDALADDDEDDKDANN